MNTTKDLKETVNQMGKKIRKMWCHRNHNRRVSNSTAVMNMYFKKVSGFDT